MRIALPDLLATKNGRLATFFLLYVTEGIPLGFTATAIATQMRRGGLGPAEIGAFVGSLYLPWAFKWAMGPFVDTFSSDRFGRRRTWIFLMQVGMMATLVAAMGVDFVGQLSLFTAIIFLHNAFGATMDVAIDALAVSALPEDERGTANGFMFAGASIGQTIGGSGVLFLTAAMPFQSTYLFVVGDHPRDHGVRRPAAARESAAGAERECARRPQRRPRAARTSSSMPGAPSPARAPRWSACSTRCCRRARTRSASPCSRTSRVELGLNDNEVAQLNLYTTLIFAPSCILGGWLSDRFGRRSTLAIFVFLTVVPTLWLAWTMWQAGWIMPVDMKMANRPQPSTVLIVTFWVACIVYNVFQGLYYGIRSALFMDVTTPAVAATQFTAYMALMNLCISYTAAWQGYVVERIGYPQTLVLDSVLGLLGLALLPLMRPAKAQPVPTAGVAPTPA